MNAPSKPAAFDPGKDVRMSPRFRVLSIGGERRGFRLEQVFWNAISAIATRNRRNLTEEVAVTLRRAPKGLNASAYLRASALADLMDLWEVAEAMAGRPVWTKVVKALPWPAFAVTRSQSLVALNEPMRAHLDWRGIPTSATGPESAISVELASGAIVQMLKADPEGLVVCNAVFRSGQHKALCRVRVIRVDDEKSELRLILGFPEQG